MIIVYLILLNLNTNGTYSIAWNLKNKPDYESPTDSDSNNTYNLIVNASDDNGLTQQFTLTHTVLNGSISQIGGDVNDRLDDVGIQIFDIAQIAIHDDESYPTVFIHDPSTLSTNQIYTFGYNSSVDKWYADGSTTNAALIIGKNLRCSPRPPSCF